MSAEIVLEDGRMFVAANWAYDAMIRRIAAAMPDTPEGKALAAWVLEQECAIRGPGLGSVDVRELTPENRKMFVQAVEDAYRMEKERGPSFAQPEAWPGWMKRFDDLIKMIESVRQGESIEAFSPHAIPVPLPPTGRHSGPGW